MDINRTIQRVKNLRQLMSDKRGSVALLFGFSLLPAIFVTGSAIDFARMQSAKQSLQTSVDGAALAAANAQSMTDQQRITLARNVFNANFKSATFGTATATATAANGNVGVVASVTVPTIFMKLARINNFALTASATSPMAGSGGVSCMLALSPDQGDAIHVQGTNNFTATNCWAWANSTSAWAISGGGSAVARATGFCAVGGYMDSSNYTPRPQTHCLRLVDPYAGKIPAPSSDECKSNSGTSYSSGTYTISPGTFCGGLTVKPQANVTFSPGVYVIKNGPLTLQAGSNVTGAGVVFYFTGSNASLQVKGGAIASLKAPSGKTLKSGVYDGMIFVQDSTANVGGTSQIQGGGTVVIDGVVYFPTQDLQIGGNGDLNVTCKLFAMVANRFYLQGNGTLYFSADAVGAGFSANLLPKIPGAGRLIN